MSIEINKKTFVNASCWIWILTFEHTQIFRPHDSLFLGFYNIGVVTWDKNKVPLSLHSVSSDRQDQLCEGSMWETLMEWYKNSLAQRILFPPYISEKLNKDLKKENLHSSKFFMFLLLKIIFSHLTGDSFPSTLPVLLIKSSSSVNNRMWVFLSILHKLVKFYLFYTMSWIVQHHLHLYLTCFVMHTFLNYFLGYVFFDTS